MGFLIKNKTSEEVINNLKYFLTILYIQTIGVNSPLFYLFQMSADHPQSQGAVESFNKIIILKIPIKKTFDKYNNTVHSSTKVEPAKAIKMKKTIKKNIRK